MNIIKKSRPQPFYLPANNPEARTREGNKLIRYLQAQSPDQHLKVVVSIGKEKRSEEQNALLWCWNQELARSHDDSYTAAQYHGMNKLEILLPLMCYEWERWREDGLFLKAAFSSVVRYEDKIDLADAYIRSSELHVVEGTLYIDRLQQHWAGRGVPLEVKVSSKKYAGYAEVSA